MRRLSKRWEPFRFINLGQLHRAFLPEVGNEVANEDGDALCWACIEFKDAKGPFRLEIWDDDERNWDEIDYFPTLKKAKEVGRLLAGIALAKNI